jgi:putative exporter of polyketide antibiotics
VPVSEVPAVSTASTPSESSDLPRPSNLGIWSFVLAILGLGLLPIVGSVVGFILGRVAIRQADTRRLRGGRGLAIAAVTISVITLVVIALSIAAYALVVAYLEI